MKEIIFLFLMCFCGVGVLIFLVKFIIVRNSKRYYDYDIRTIDNFKIEGNYIYFTMTDQVYRKITWFKCLNTLKEANINRLINELRHNSQYSSSGILIERDKVNSVVFVELTL
jgi:hypothetical protein